jgi:hypothetical protein
VAERPCEPGSVLLLNEFFEVIVKEDGRREEARVWQCMGFSTGGAPNEGNLDVNMVEPNGRAQVQGACHAPARVVLGHRRLPGNAHTHDEA